MLTTPTLKSILQTLSHLRSVLKASVLRGQSIEVMFPFFFSYTQPSGFAFILIVVARKENSTIYRIPPHVIFFCPQ